MIPNGHSYLSKLTAKKISKFPLISVMNEKRHKCSIMMLSFKEVNKQGVKLVRTR